jgi:mRNA-degrading endonuclease RelE of RelBE toxin-antitoxin system
VEVDLELHKAIERHRRSLDETHADIVRRLITSEARPVSPIDVPATELLGRVRRARRGGDYRVVVLGESLEAQSLKDILKKAVLHAESIKPGFIERLAAHRTRRGRRIVARKPDEIYPGNSQLVANCAEKLDQKWWYDTNVSYPQYQKYLTVLGQIGGFPEPRLERK